MSQTPQTPYYLQNLHTAFYVLKLIDPATTFISVTPEADPKGAPHIEDFVIQHDNGYDYYQVKTSIAENFTTGDLMEIWRKLAIGWEKVRGRATSTARLFLLTNRPFGNQSSTDSKGLKRPALTHIIEKLINPCKEAVASGRIFRPTSDLAEFWQYLKKESRLNNLFDVYVSHLNFCPPDLRTLDELQEALINKVISFVALPHEAKKMTDVLIAAVTEWAAVREQVTPIKLKKRLDISDRGKLLHEHTLTDLIPKEYTPFGNIQEALEENIRSMQKGIIFLRGVPGSGKTVAITKFIESRQDICLRYYAYNPREHSDRTERVQQKDFYHDLLIQLAKRFPERTIPSYIDPNQDHRRLFWEKINEIGHEVFQQTPLIIIIDGLDHAARAKAFSVQTFLDGLKGPDELPDNVILLLSGQPSWEGYPIWLEDRDIVRIIDIPPMKIDEINAYLKNSGLWLFDPSLCMQVSYILCEHTEGNPLSVRYAAQAIKECDSFGSVKEVLAKGMLPGKDLQLYYGRLWEDISRLSVFQVNKGWLQNAQAIFVVSQEPIIPDLFEALDITPPYAVPILVTLNPILSTTEKGKIIYHNDFRLYIESKLDGSVIKYVNYKLADYYMKHPDTEGYHAYVVNHYWEAKEYKQVLQIVTQARYDDKIKKNRSDDEIISELGLALECSLNGDDLLEIVRLGLMIIRNGIRVNHWENVKEKEHFFSTELEARSKDPLSEIPPHPSELALERRAAVLRLIPRLMRKGEEPLARRLWSLWNIDPITFLNVEASYGQRNIPHNAFPYIQAWIKCALIFNKNRVIELNEYLQGKVKEGEEDWEKTNIAVGFASYTKVSIWKVLPFESALSFIDEIIQRGWVWNLSDILWGAEYYIYRDKREYAAKLIEEAIPLAEKEGGYLAARTAWFCIIFNRIDNAEVLSKNMTLPLSTEYPNSIRSLIHDGSEKDVYRYFAVKAYFDVTSPLSSFRVDFSKFSDIDAPFTGDPLMRLFPLMALIGRLERNVDLVPQYEIIETLGPILSNHQGNLKELSEDLTGHCLYKLSESDRNRGIELAKWISELYCHNKLFEYKINPFIRWLYEHGQAKLLESIVERLTKVENLGNRLSTDRAEQFLDAASITTFLGDATKSNSFFAEARLASEGLGHEDYQVSDWADTIIRLIKCNRDLGFILDRRFIYYAILAEKETDGSGGRRAIEKLVPAIFLESPVEGKALCMEISEGMKAVSLEDGILVRIAEEWLTTYGVFDRNEWCSLAALLLVSPKPGDKFDDEFSSYNNAVRSLEYASKRIGVTSGGVIEYLISGIKEREEKQKENAEGYQIVRLEDVKEWMRNSRDGELFHFNYSDLQKKMFAALKELSPNEGWRIYKDACIYHLQNNNKGMSSFSVSGMISFLLDLIPDTFLEEVSKILDEHMQRVLRHSLYKKPPPDTKLTTSEAGHFFETTSMLIAHLLNTRHGRTLSETGRALSVLSEANADFIINVLIDYLGTKDQFVDVRILEVLNGIMHNCPANFKPHLIKLREFFESCKDLRRKCLILKIFNHLRRIENDIDHIALNVNDSEVFIEPADMLKAKREDETNKELFIHRVNDQIDSFSKRLGGVTRKILSKEDWFSYIKAYITPSNSRRTFSFSSSHPVYNHPPLTENDVGQTASEVAWKLLASKKLPLSYANPLNQALTGVDPILLTAVPNKLPEYIPSNMEDYAKQPISIDGTNGWAVIGLTRMQGKETSYVSIRLCSGLFPQSFYKECKEINIAKALHGYVGTFGWTLASAYEGAWYDVSALKNNDPYIPLVVPSGSLIPFPLLMTDIALWDTLLKAEGLYPNHLKPTSWLQGNKEILSFTMWDNGTEYESPRSGENTDYGFLWLARTDWLTELQKKYNRSFIQLVEIDSGTRKYRDKPFEQPTRAWHAIFPEIS